MDGAHTKTQGGIYPNTPQLFALAYEYDKESNRTAAYDVCVGALQAQSYEYGYDGLDRLTEAVKGSGPSGGSFAPVAGGEKWNLDMLGNWQTDASTSTPGLRIDTASTYGTFDGSDTDQDREHNGVNELYDIDGNLLEYDHAGNLRHRFINGDDGYRYTHDAWNRLVKVEFVEDIAGTEVIEVRGEYAYNGLHQRTVHRLDTNDPPDGSLDQQRFMYYDASWRLIEEEIWDGWSSGTPGSIDRHIHYTWGARYIDDLAFRRVDNNGNGDYTDGGDKTYYHITDAQFSTRMILDPSAAIVEWVDYTPYGEARHHHRYDVDGDGDFDASDRSIVTTLADLAGFPPDPTDIDEIGYRAEADINRDGTIDGSDVTAIGTSYTSAISAGLVSTPAGECDNLIGYDGYIFNAESMQFTVRHRVYDPAAGRWLQRDPSGYVDSMNLYNYVNSRPADRLDPSGLQYLLNKDERKVIKDHANRHWQRECGHMSRWQKVKSPWCWVIISSQQRDELEVCLQLAAHYARRNQDRRPPTSPHPFLPGILPDQSPGGVIPGEVNGNADAMRHCILACELAKCAGRDFAIDLLDAHEKKNGKPMTGPASNMDRCNNKVGVEFGQFNYDCHAECWGALVSRRLCVINPYGCEARN